MPATLAIGPRAPMKLATDLPAPAPLTDAPNEPFVNQAILAQTTQNVKVGPPGGAQQVKPMTFSSVLSIGNFATAPAGADLSSVLSAALARAKADPDGAASGVVQGAQGALLVGRVVSQPVSDPQEKPQPYSLPAAPATEQLSSYEPRIVALVDKSGQWVNLRPDEG